jgi:excisionase family DNA binding protein
MEFLTTAQVAKLLNVSDETVRRWIVAGQLPGVRMTEDSWYRVSRSQLEEYAQKRGIPLNWSLLDS